MEKRYQVFVSSTYADLKEERRAVIQTLMEMDCIPAGMEMFPAADDEQYQFIKRVIDDCDYYILIIGGRYGSVTQDGVSYTEKEYDYALDKGLKVLAFVHEDPSLIPVGKSDISPDLRAKLEAFRARVCANRLIKFWKEASELPGLVALSLSKTIKTYPAVGWMRASNVAQGDALSDILGLRKANEQLLAQIGRLESELQKENTLELASFEESFRFSIEQRWRGVHRWESRRVEITKTWRELFAFISPELVQYPVETIVADRFAKHLLPDASGTVTFVRDDLLTIRTQFVALGLIDAKYTKATDGSMGMFWGLTGQGQRLMMQLRTVKSSES